MAVHDQRPSDPATVLPLPSALSNSAAGKPAFVEPKLTWIEPQLVPQGTLTGVAQTGGFFGSFSP